MMRILDISYLSLILSAVLVNSISIFRWRRQHRPRSLSQSMLIWSISKEFRKPFHLKRVFAGVLDLILFTMHSLDGAVLIIYGKDAGHDKLRVVKGLHAEKNLFDEEARKDLDRDNTLTLRENLPIDDRGQRVAGLTFFPIVVRHHVVGALGVAYRKKRLSATDFRFIEIIMSQISLEFEDRLLQTKLDAFTKGLSLVEYSYESIVDNLPSGVVVLDTDRQILLLNNMMKSIIRAEEPIGKDYLELFSNKETVDQVDKFLDKIHKAQLLSTLDGLEYSSKGMKKILDLTGYPLFDAQNNIVAYILIHEDITERHRLQQKLKQTQEKAQQELQEKVAMATSELVDANRELIRLNKMKSEFVAVISHELKTPLTSIKGYLRLLESERLGKLSKQQKESLGIVAEESDRLATLINDVLDLSRLESGKTTLKLEKVTLQPIIKEVIPMLRPQAKEKQVKLEVQCRGKACQTKIDVDPVKIRQVIINLLSNAVKFTPEKGKVTLEVKAHKHVVEMIVRDTGIGISKEDQKHLFQPFYQVEDHLTRSTKGTGLGLTITRHIVDLHHGAIKVESEPGTGTDVSVTIPKNLGQMLRGS